MTNSFTKCAALVASLLIGGGVAFAHNAGEVGTATSGHVRDSNNHSWKNSSGECWHLGSTPGDKDCTVQPPPPPPPPPPVAAAEPPPPPPPPPAPKPVKQKVTLQGDALFDFDKAVLKPGDITELDGEIAKIRGGGVTTESITTTGHTDGIGTDAYNDKLSLRRAQAVKDYLISKGVDANKISVEGKGKRQPVASNKTKEGRAKNRRVEIEFSGVETVLVK